jgi:hypothetical protein
MTERKAELKQLTTELEAHDAIESVFLAKSFTDRLVILDITGETVPADVKERLADHDLRSAEDVYDGGSSFTGDVGDAARHHFVDIQTRGSHQSYVVE